VGILDILEEKKNNSICFINWSVSFMKNYGKKVADQPLNFKSPKSIKADGRLLLFMSSAKNM